MSDNFVKKYQKVTWPERNEVTLKMSENCLRFKEITENVFLDEVKNVNKWN